MLTRVYIDNFMCFVNFEYRPERTQLIFGGNGSGKSSFMTALLTLRQFAISGIKADQLFVTNLWTRWLDQPNQTFELEARLDARKYIYRLVVEKWGDQGQARVVSETVTCDAKPLFEFKEGDVSLYNDRSEKLVNYPFERSRSALETIGNRNDNQLLTRFKTWFARVHCFRIDPFSMTLRAEREDLYPNLYLSNFAAWYRHLIQSDQKTNGILFESLRASLNSFSTLNLEFAGESARVLVADFDSGAGKNIRYGFNELSEGQRCLICLYAILHFLIAKGHTVIIDEPDNFIALREIQPWLAAVVDAAEEGSGQILLISHHPEIINQRGPESGVQFIREGVGPVRIKEFIDVHESGLPLAELIARGWEND